MGLNMLLMFRARITLKQLCVPPLGAGVIGSGDGGDSLARLPGQGAVSSDCQPDEEWKALLN